MTREGDGARKMFALTALCIQQALGELQGGSCLNRYEISLGQIDIFVNGALERKTLGNLFEVIASDPRFRCDLNQFWHFQEVDCPTDDLSWLPALGLALEEDRRQTYPPVAFIAESDLLFGLCRVYAGWVGCKSLEISVFRHYDDALAWAYCTGEPSKQSGMK